MSRKYLSARRVSASLDGISVVYPSPLATWSVSECLGIGLSTLVLLAAQHPQLFYIDISHVFPLKICSVTEMGVGDVNCIIFRNAADFSFKTRKSSNRAVEKQESGRDGSHVHHRRQGLSTCNFISPECLFPDWERKVLIVRRASFCSMCACLCFATVNSLRGEAFISLYWIEHQSQTVKCSVVIEFL